MFSLLGQISSRGRYSWFVQDHWIFKHGTVMLIFELCRLSHGACGEVCPYLGTPVMFTESVNLKPIRFQNFNLTRISDSFA